MSQSLCHIGLLHLTFSLNFKNDEEPLDIYFSSSLMQAYIHTRMRAKTSDFLKVLNRARPDAEKKEMKTIT